VDALLDYNRRLNRVFGVCVLVKNTARPLADQGFRMELLARNGVAHAARLDRDRGRSLAVLTSFLSELPEQIGPVVRGVESRCVRLCETMAACTQSMRVYSALVAAVRSVGDLYGRPGGARRPASNGLRLDVLESDVVPGGLPDRPASGARRILERCHTIRTHVADDLRAARGEIEGIREHLDELRRATRQSRYISQCIRVEVSQIADGGHRFESFAGQVATAVEDLEDGLRALDRTSLDGAQLLDTLGRELEP